MMGLDTNIWARYYIEDMSDDEAGKQQQIARNIVESGKELMVSKTVLLELEWVMRGYYRFKSEQVLSVFQHLLSLPQLMVETINLKRDSQRRTSQRIPVS